MKAVIQRVLKASVTVSEELVGSIQQGLCVLIGISRDDTDKDMEFIAKKLLSLKLFDSTDGKAWSNSVVDSDFEVLCVSQFTLQARTSKGAKPDFHLAMFADKSEDFYNKFLDLMKSKYKADKIQNGKFGANMQVHIQNDGPVTIIIDSNESKKPEESPSKPKEKTKKLAKEKASPKVEVTAEEAISPKSDEPISNKEETA